MPFAVIQNRRFFVRASGGSAVCIPKADRSLLISGPPPFDLVLGHVFNPNDSVAANEIMRAAREIPTTNGRKQRHSFASNVSCQPTGLIDITTFTQHPQKRSGLLLHRESTHREWLPGMNSRICA